MACRLDGRCFSWGEGERAVQSEESPVDQLSERERRILELLAAGLSDQQIAGELYLSLNTVKWYNRQIYAKLGVGSRTQAIAQAQQLGWLASAAMLSAARDPDAYGLGAQESPLRSLPLSPNPFIGRQAALEDIMRLLVAQRLVTLTGPGGIGKTSLALRLAAQMAALYADGVFFVDLAPLTDPTQVAAAIARVLDIAEQTAQPPADLLRRILAPQALLLLLDNFEHVLGAAPLVADLLAAAPRLTVLVTSRAPLHLNGEQQYPVPPLHLPAPDTTSTAALLASEAGALFVQRVQMALPHFMPNAESIPSIVQICARLDGLPLAIELAAARSKVLPPAALLERLNTSRSQSSLYARPTGARNAPRRQQTLHDSISWSYNLLEAEEKVLFARLAVFRGGATLEAIEAVCSPGLNVEVLDTLASLVDKSLVQQRETAQGAPRFGMLEMIGEYARHCWEAAGEEERLRRQHAAYYVELAEQAEPELRLSRYDEWCRLLELELDNVRAALAWTLAAGEATLGVRLASALGLFWYGRGFHVEGIGWMQQLQERLDTVPLDYHSRFLISAAHMIWLNALDDARLLLERALAAARELGQTLEEAWALAFLGYTHMQEPQVGLALVEESLALFRTLDHPPGIAQALNIIGEIARFSGDDNRAKHAYAACLLVAQQTGEARRICYMASNLAYIAQHEGDHVRAVELGRQCLQLARQRQDRRDMADTLTVLAGSLAVVGDARQAVRLLAAAERALERMGSFLQPIDVPEHARNVAALRARLGDAVYTGEWTAGLTMPLETAVTEGVGKL